MNQEAQRELRTDASALAYVHIKHSGLWKEISNDERYRLADEWGKRIVNLLDEFTDSEFTKIEDAKVKAGLDAVEHQ